ncbi:MAG: InlB B-repeat-containing protein, partial [Bacilli bacterium]|nr:InlB B-repeat-containing protein [Bacilli bacterium]
NSIDATSYQISIDNMNWSSLPKGEETTSYNFLNSIVSDNGNRTIYVKGVGGNSNYIDTLSTVFVDVYEVSFESNNIDYGVVEPENINVISGGSYTTSGNQLTFVDGRSVTAKTKDATGYVTSFSNWSSTSGTIIEDTTVGANFTGEVINGIIYNANGGEFANHSSTNDVIYTMGQGEVIKYSHTSNIDDTGIKNSDYGNSWNNSNIRGSDRGDTSKAHVISIPGASTLTVELYYNGESVSYDWVSVWAGNYPNYTAASNATSTGYVTTAMGGVSGNKFGGSQSGSYTVNGNSLTNMGHSTLTIPGDTVTFAFKSDGSGVGKGYGYYAIVKGMGSTPVVYSGTYEEPVKEGATFLGWYKDRACSDGEEFNINQEYNHLMVYAKYGYTITYNTNGGSNVSPSSVMIDEGDAITSLPTTTKSNNIFAGWYTDLTAGIKIEVGYIPDTSMELYARWKKSVAYMDIDPIVITSPTGAFLLVKNPEEIGEEYTITSGDSSILTINEEGRMIPTADESNTTITITGVTSHQTKVVNVSIQYAKHTIIFDSNGGSYIENKVVLEEPIGELPEPYLDFYDFIGWYTELTSGVKVEEDYIPLSDTTLYARYEKASTHTITFDYNGGVGFEVTREVTSDLAIGELPSPVRNNDFFIGWMDTVTGEYYLSTTRIRKDVVLTAQWSSTEKAARIGTTFYNTIQAAINAANEGDVVIVLSDRTENLTNAKNITLHLDKHTLTGQITNNQGGDLTLLAGNIVKEGNSSNEKAITNTGTLTIGSENPKLDDGVDISVSSSYTTTSNTTNYVYGIYNSSGTLVMNNGNIIIEDNKTSTNSSTKYNAYGIYGGVSVTMNGGKIKHLSTVSGKANYSVYGIATATTITMNGG